MASSKSTSKASNHSKATAKLHAKRARRIKTGLLPDPELGISIDDYTSFATHLHSSQNILALLGAGLSTASGVPTFRGAGGFWRKHDATELGTPEAFAKDPSTVTQFYHYRRLLVCAAKPNRGHFALAELARRRGKDFLTITQNVDGLSERAGHAEGSLLRVHGSLHEVKCSQAGCDYRRVLGREESLCPALAMDKEVDSFADETKSLPVIADEDLPHCPECKGLLRPAVVWFGEPILSESRDLIHDWLDVRPKVDLMLVVGTSAVVFPAAAYIHAARVQGARIAVINTEEPSEEDQGNPVTALREGVDWLFQGSAADLLPDLLKEVIGSVSWRDA